MLAPVKGEVVEPNPTETYTLWGNIGGWLLAFFLTKKALSDRDKRLEDLDRWVIHHEENHPSINEFLRMHVENREMMQHILDMIQKNNVAREGDFKHLNDRIDKVMERKNFN